MLVSAAIGSVAVAILAGLALWVFDPSAGSAPEAALGVAAALGGLATAVFVISAAIYAQIKDLWRHAPRWIRTAVMVIVVVGLIVTVAGWFR